jgi:hypothetical protein
MLPQFEFQFVELNQALEPVVEFLNQCLQQGKRIDEVERGLHERLRALGLKLVGDFVAAAGDGDEGLSAVHHELRLQRSAERHTRKYHSIFGRLEISRYVYQVRAKQAAQYIPTDEKLGLPAGEQSYVLEDWSQRLATNQPYAETRDILKELLGADLPVRALEHMNTRLAEQVNPYWESAAPPPADEEGELLVVTADGKGVPMRQNQQERYEQELGKKKPKRRKPLIYEKTTKRGSCGVPKCRKQMAYLGVVYSVDRFVRRPEEIVEEVQRQARQQARPEPKHKHYRAEMNLIEDQEISKGQPRLFEWLAAEVAARNAAGKKPVVCLMDGQQSLWFRQREHLPDAVGILDIFHVLDKLWEAAHCFHRESSLEAEQFVGKYLAMMLEGNTGSVIGVFKRFVRELSGAKQKQLEAVIRFFDNNKHYMRYGDYIQAGYPIGSGVVEGGCRHVVRDRMELSGMRWNVEGAQSMLRLRTTKLAGDWKSFIAFRIRAEQAHLYHQAA